MKQTISDYLENEFALKNYSETANVEDLYNWIVEVRKQGAKELYISTQVEYDTSHVESIDLTALVEREETDQEYKDRLKREENEKEAKRKWAEKLKDQEINQLKYLKEKYPNE